MIVHFILLRFFSGRAPLVSLDLQDELGHQALL